MQGMKVEIIEPHGLCAGVNAAIAKALKLRDVYCLHELVHNEIVIEELKALGYRFVGRVEDVPEGATVVFSAHGVSPAVRAAAEGRRHDVSVRREGAQGGAELLRKGAAGRRHRRPESRRGEGDRGGSRRKCENMGLWE